MERLPGTPYLAGDVMGRGPHGAVLVGRDALDRRLAVKVLTPELSGDPATAADFAGQRDILLSVRHPHLVPVYDILPTDSGVLAIVTDRAEGGNLRQALEVVRTFPPSEACRLGAQLARALAAVHSAGLIHGDLVATNVLFNDAGSRPAVRVSDTGLTRWLASVGRGWVPTGAHAYASPEAAAGGVPGPPADLYSLGVLLHEMCVGVPPFTGDPAEVMRRHVDEVPVRPAGIPDQLWVLIAALLAKDGAARVGPAAAVAGYLDAIAADVDRVPPAAPLGPMAAAAAVAPLPDLSAPAVDPWAAEAASEGVSPTDETDVLPAAPVSYEPAAFEPVAEEPVAWTPPPGDPAPWERPPVEAAYPPVSYEPVGYEPVGYEPVEVAAADATRDTPAYTTAYLASVKRQRRRKTAAIAAAVLVPLVVLGAVIASVAGGGDDGDGVVEDPVVLPTPAVPGDLATPTPTPTISASPSASASPTATPSPTPTPRISTPTPTPTPRVTPRPTPRPTPTPTPPPTPTPTPTPTATPPPTPPPTPTPTPAP